MLQIKLRAFIFSWFMLQVVKYQCQEIHPTLLEK